MISIILVIRAQSIASSGAYLRHTLLLPAGGAVPVGGGKASIKNDTVLEWQSL